MYIFQVTDWFWLCGLGCWRRPRPGQEGVVWKAGEAFQEKEVWLVCFYCLFSLFSE